MRGFKDLINMKSSELLPLHLHNMARKKEDAVKVDEGCEDATVIFGLEHQLLIVL